MYRWTKTVLMLLVVLAFGACSNNKADIGDGTAISKLGENLSDYEGTWEGYAEAYTFSDKSDKVMLMLDTNGENGTRS
jgi:hypothetical protein